MLTRKERMLELPPFLTRDEGGYIRLTGYRIGLHHVVRLIRKGYTAQRLAEEAYDWPIQDLMQQVIDFYHANRAAVDEYVAEQDADAERQIAAHPPSPAQLRIRRLMEARGIRPGTDPDDEF